MLVIVFAMVCIFSMLNVMLSIAYLCNITDLIALFLL